MGGVQAAVLKCAPHEWYSVGCQLGFTDGQLTDMTQSLGTGAGKLEKIVNVKVAEVGGEEAARMLLEACKRLPIPVIDAVRRRLEQTHHP